jgi:hypothetical protein
MSIRLSLVASCLTVAAAVPVAQTPVVSPPRTTADSIVGVAGTRFRVHTIGSDLTSGYQVVAVDLTRDGRKDLIALTEGLQELVWFEAPTWTRHVLIDGVRNMSSMAAHDIDGDGVPELALGYAFSGRPVSQPGLVNVLRHTGNPRERWTMTEIDKVPTVHRLRWIDVDGSGRKVLLNGPMVNPTEPNVSIANPVPVYLYHPEDWRRETLTEVPHGYLHGLTVVDWDGRGPHNLLTASSLGIHVWRRNPAGAWIGQLLTAGNPEPWPRAGSADVVVGRTPSRRFMAAIEPYHGNIVAVYTERGGLWQRQVIDDTIVTGHAIAIADFNADGRDDVVVGFRGKGHRLYLYTADDPGAERWTRQVIDEGGVAAAACIAEDILGDARPDIACMGSSTSNLRVYENLGPQ